MRQEKRDKLKTMDSLGIFNNFRWDDEFVEVNEDCITT